ncbi:MAG TPA: hypothetical protein VGH28_15740 [Polyangiaceae bacterium]|jgi:hypothetical protein
MRRLLLVLPVAVACGPSFQTIYENDARFEHCYATDDSASTSLAQKAACWKDWKEHHTFGQTRDRVEYAQSRYLALSQMPDMPTDEAMMQAAPGEVGEQHQLTAPTPTNAFAPPQAIASLDAGAKSAQPPPAITAFVEPAALDAGVSESRPPGAVCTDDCARVWNECKAGRDEHKCTPAYDRCVVGCVTKK